MWIFRLGCTPYVASAHVNSWLILSDPITLLPFIYCFINCITRFSFDFTSKVIFVTLVHRNNTPGSISGFPPFPPIVFLWLYSVGFFLLIAYPVWVNFNLFFVNPIKMVMILLHPELLHMMLWIPPCNTSWTLILSCFLKNICPFPETWDFSLYIRWVHIFF